MEDFVTFEIAKKLKKKGFREKCLTYYDVDDNIGLLYNTQYSDGWSCCQYTDLLESRNVNGSSEPDDSENCVDAPTISQVLKWLREKEIYVLMECPLKLDDGKLGWFYTICNRPISEDNQEVCISRSGIYDSYEDAALMGIKNVLNNFI